MSLIAKVTGAVAVRFALWRARRALASGNAAAGASLYAAAAVLAQACGRDGDAYRRSAARRLLSSGRADLAIELYSKIQHTPPSDFRFLSTLANAAAEAQDDRTEIDALRLLLRIDLSADYCHLRLAELLQADDPKAALPHLQFAANSAPDRVENWRLLARARMAHDDRDGAAAALSRAVALDPNDRASRVDLAESLWAQGRVAESLPHYEALSLQPGMRCEWWRRIALARKRNADVEGEIAALRNYLSECPGDAIAQHRLGKLWLQKGEPAQALVPLEAGAVLAVNARAVLSDLARAHRELKDADGELRALIRLHKTKADPKTAGRIGKLLAVNGDRRDSIPYLKEAVSAGDIGKAPILATQLAAEGDTQGALEVWRSIIAVKPGDLQAHAAIADIFVGAGRFKEARPYVEMTAASRPGDARIKRRLADVYAADEEWARAAVLLEELSAASPADKDLLADLARAHRMSGDRVGERAVLRQLAKLSPSDFSVRSRYAELLLESKSFDKAAAHFVALKEHAPGNLVAHFGLARCYKRLSRVSEEISVLIDLLAIKPGLVKYRVRLAELLFGERRIKEAREHVVRCAKKSIGDPSVQRLIARIETALRPRRASAEAAWRRLLELAPGDAEATAELAAIAYHDHDFPRAHRLFEDLFRQTPGSPEQHLQLAHCTRRVQGADAELKCLEAALGRFPANSALQYLLAYRCLAADFARGLDLFHSAWRASGDPKHHAKVARLIARLGRADIALEAHRLLTKEAPQSPYGWLGLARTMHRLERFRLAATYFAKVFEVSGAVYARNAWLECLTRVGASAAVEESIPLLRQLKANKRTLAALRVETAAGQNEFARAHRLANREYFHPDNEYRNAYVRYLKIRARLEAHTVAEFRGDVRSDWRDSGEALQVEGRFREAADHYRHSGATLESFSDAADGVGRGLDFLVLGAGGGVDCALENALARFPQIALVREESGYFSQFLRLSPSYLARKIANCVKAAGDSGAARIGEVRNDYWLLDGDAIALCAALLPELRVIGIVGDPVRHLWARLHELRLASMRPDFYLTALGAPAPLLQRLANLSRHRSNLRCWAGAFPPERILLLRTEIVEDNPAQAAQSIAEFLGLGGEIASSPESGRARAPRRPDLSPDMREFLNILLTDEGYDLAEPLLGEGGSIAKIGSA